MFLRGHHNVKARMAAYLEKQDALYLSIITLYEILSGLEHRDAHKQMGRFRDFSRDCVVCPLTEDSVRISARFYAKLRQEGKTLDDLDLLIAGTALANELVIVTHNRRHFDRIEGLEVEDWSEAVANR